MNKFIKLLSITGITLFSITAFADVNNLKVNASQEKSLENVIETQTVNINNANESALASLKGIGIKRAKAIISYRQKMGKFKTMEDLLKVKGIGEQFLVKNKARLAI